MISILLLLTVTVLYASYNLLVKVSSGHVPDSATTTILATVCLQVAALLSSMVFAGVLLARGGHVLQLSPSAYLWAVGAGICIGFAEIAYFYLFGGIGGLKPMAASVAIPVIVSGTIVITQAAGVVMFDEALNWTKVAGCGCIILGIVVLFHGR
ncbi:MAG: hypothetical protein AAF495_19640 [Pseudomonadota bacterium]